VTALLAPPLLIFVLLFVAPVATLPSGAAPSDCAAADTGVRVKLVIDYGILAAEQQAPATVSTTCVTTAGGASGLQALEAGGHTYRLNNGTGLLCAIDGFPSGSECGDRNAEGYRYWAYFSGGSTWTYSGIGPAGRRVNEGSVEGWHFVSGKGNPTDPPPAASPQPCAPTPTTPPPTAAPPTSAPRGPAPTSSPPPTNGNTGGAGNGAGRQPVPTLPGAGPTTVPADRGSSATTVPGATTPGASGAADPSVPGTAPDGGTSPADATEPAAGAPGTTASPTGASDGTGPDSGSGLGAGTVDVAATPTAARAAGPGAPVTAILGVIAVLALGGFAVFRMRARPEDL
jgi:hypothetical protein